MTCTGPPRGPPGAEPVAVRRRRCRGSAPGGPVSCDARPETQPAPRCCPAVRSLLSLRARWWGGERDGVRLVDAGYGGRRGPGVVLLRRQPPRSGGLAAGMDRTEVARVPSRLAALRRDVPHL